MAPHYTTILVTTTLAISIFFLPICSSSDFVDNTCKQTSNYQTCVSTIKSDPKSSSARDVTSLALIMVNSLKSKSNSALFTINQLLKSKSTSSASRVGLNQCLKRYNFILRYDVTEAVEALTKGDPKFAEDATRDAAFVVQECEDGFHSKLSPISNLNRAARDTADVATSLVRMLL
ncbi:OLC1v1020698C1 [Oldenlandia corymbosa var. corymbosa]|uniref:OLC1v1020698C1 n=1 Tax=Oldenlandia corymbosa var. corymbosa TaxID=529605 RepID=A0AAV1EH63_OLDCO|nr:OLC1v1020698C1 [Oldenlandia corymbosa var. corymbosa]